MAKTKTASRVNTRIRTGDVVQVISGKDAAGRKRNLKEGEDAKLRQKRGKVLSIDRDKGRAVVQGLNMVFKHQKASQDPSAPKVGRIEMEAPLRFSKLMLVCPKCDAATRVGIRSETHEREGGKKKVKRVRVCKKCGADIPERT